MIPNALEQVARGGLFIFWILAATGPAQALEAPAITDISLPDSEIRQGDRFEIILGVYATSGYENVTASFEIQDQSDRQAAAIETDFFEIRPSGHQEFRFTFRWTDLSGRRPTRLKFSKALLKQYDGSAGSPAVLAKLRLDLPFRAFHITDAVERMFVSRDNSLWWLVEMGRVDNRLTRKNGLSNCVMYGGGADAEIRNDHLGREGTQGRCYWEITGYAVRTLALEYERTGNGRYLDHAMAIADSILSNIDHGSASAMSRGSLPTYTYMDGREVEAYRGLAMLFDHGQVLMGLLELGRVMREAELPAAERAPYEMAAREIGEFILRTRERNGGRIPTSWDHREEIPSGDWQPTSKVVIGFPELGRLTGRPDIVEAAQQHLVTVENNMRPYRGSDHHGRSYVAYGFLRAFQDYGSADYLIAARTWTEAVAADMDAAGRLMPASDYSAVPAQSQVIRNATILWELTGDPAVLEWAERSAGFLATSRAPWTDREAVLKLGRFYRLAGGQFNNIEASELCSWASIFYIDAMYHFLRAKYGHVFVGPQNVISMAGHVAVQRGREAVNIELRGRSKENVGIYIAGNRKIRAVEIGGRGFAYYSDQTVRLPASHGQSQVRVVFGQDGAPHLTDTNSLVLAAELDGGTKVKITVQGSKGTTGVMHIHWPGSPPSISLNSAELDRSAWNRVGNRDAIEIRYQHDGQPQLFVIEQNG